MPGLEIKPIESLGDAYDILWIRNTGREFMTHDTRKITEEEQVRWYNNVYRPDAHLIAFIGRLRQNAAAYGMIAEIDDKYWLTGIIAPEQRGKGYGEQLFRHLGDYVFQNFDNHVFLDVRRDNQTAINLYEKLGYVACDEQSNGVIVMKLEEAHVQA